MNDLQTFIARANLQSRATIQEAFTVGSQTVYLTIGQVQPSVDMLRQGYNEWAVATASGLGSQFSAQPAARSTMTRVATGKVYFIQKLDADDPVIWEFTLVDRDPN